MPKAFLTQIVTEIDPAQLKSAEEALSAVPNGFKVAAKSAINRGSVSNLAKFARTIQRDGTKLRIKDIKRHTKRLKATNAKLVGGYGLGSRGLNLYRLGARERKPAGVDFVVLGHDYLLPHAFQMRLNNGHILIARRTGNIILKVPAWAVRAGLDIEPRKVDLTNEVSGPSLAEYIREHGGPRPQVESLASDVSHELQGQIKRLLNKQAPDTSEPQDSD